MFAARTGLLMALLAGTVLVACHGCDDAGSPAQAERSAGERKRAQGPTYLPVTFRATEEQGGSESLAETEHGKSLVLVIEASRLLLAGELDKENRYSFAVVVYARVSNQEKRCSGVLLDRRTVLTAGHCVCARASPSNNPVGSLIDTSNCALTASVKTYVYTAVNGLEEAASSSSNLYFGSVQPHPGLQIRLDEQGSVVSSAADLAAIHLESPVEEAFAPVLLPATEVQPLESLLIVGQAYDEIVDHYEEDRRFSRNTVTRIPVTGDERILVRQPGGHRYKGDSGGPCLREHAGHTVLIGVSSRNLGAEAACSSIYPYRDWLRHELGRTGRDKGP